MTAHTISDELLKLTVESKIEAGVRPATIRQLVEAFASYDEEPSGAAEIVGFLDVEDISHGRRETFLNALLVLTEETAHSGANLRRKLMNPACPAMTFSARLVSKAKAIVRLRAQPA